MWYSHWYWQTAWLTAFRLGNERRGSHSLFGGFPGGAHVLQWVQRGRKGLGFVLKVGVAHGNGAFLTTGHICHNLPLCSSSQSYLQDTISPMPMRYQTSSEFGLYLKVPCFYDWVHMSLLITIIDSCFPVCFLLLLLVNEWEGSSSEIWNLRI